MNLRPNTIYCGDCLDILGTPYYATGGIDLIYADPPFFSQKNYEVIWGDADEVRSFKDRWEGGIRHYVEWIKPRIRLCHQNLKTTGSMYLHCDYHANAHLRILMDEIFGADNFRNEIIWAYEGGGRSKDSKFARKHDTLLLYSKSNVYTFNMNSVLLPHTEAQLKRYQIIKDGKRFANMKGKLRPLSKGKIPTDVWHDIAPLSCNEAERQGYPTQKPEALLERVIKASSNVGDLVLDPFAGCGTTVVVSQKLNRQFIGMDISPIACKLIARRLDFPEVDIIGLPVTINDLHKMKSYEFQQWACDKMLAKNTSRSKNAPSGADMGKDGIVTSNELTGKYGGSPIQVKQSDGVGVNVVKNLFATMHDMKIKTGFIVGLSFGSGAVEQVASYKQDENPVEIKLVTADELSKLKHYNYTNLGLD